MWRALATLITVLWIPATGDSLQTPSQEPSLQLPADLERVLRDYESRWQARDAHGLAQLFTADGYVLQAGHSPVKGRPEIERAYADAGGPLSLRALAFENEGKVGYIIGCFARHRGERDVGKFTLALRKDENGRWLIVSDMDNSNR